MRHVHAPGPELARQRLRQSAEGEFARREGGAGAAAFDGGGCAGEEEGWWMLRGSGGGLGDGGEEVGEEGAGEVEGAFAVGGDVSFFIFFSLV